MSSDTVTGRAGTGALERLAFLVRRAELLVDVEERVEVVVCRGEGLPYDGPGPAVAGWRSEIDALLVLLDGPPAAGEMDQALTRATRLVRLLEQHGAQGGAAGAGAPPVSG